MATYTSLTAADRNWCSVSMWNEITTVANEVSAALGLSTKSASIAGRNAASCVSSGTYWTIYDLQRLVYTYFTSFIPSNTVLEGSTSATPPSNYSSWTTFCTNAGLSSSGFRRITTQTWPTDWTDVDDAAYSYGYAQPGDVVGPWNWEDIRLAFDEMTVMLKAGFWDYGDDTTLNSAETDGPASSTVSWEEAKTNHTAEWSYEENNRYSDPSIWYTGYHDPTQPRWIPEAASTYNKGNVVAVGSVVKVSKMEFFARATTHFFGGGDETFNANGADVVNGQWHEYDEILAGFAATTTSDTLGDTGLSEPVAAADPEGATSDRTSTGWSLDPIDPYALITFEWSYSS